MLRQVRLVEGTWDGRVRLAVEGKWDGSWHNHTVRRWLALLGALYGLAYQLAL